MRAAPLVSSVMLVLALGAHWSASPARAASAREIDAKATAALDALLEGTPAARALAEDAKAILVFPKIRKAGFVVGAQAGTGVLRENGKSVAYYRSVAASYGLQAGVQSFGYVLMFMDDESRAYLDKSGGWEIGVGPSVVVVDEGVAKTITSTTLREGVYAFVFGQKGLMAGIGVQGSKITRIHPEP